MKQRSNLFARSILAIVTTYAVLGGATGSGLLTPQYRLTTLIFVALVAVGWLIIRWRHGWIWHQTPLTGALLGWGAAFVIATVANPDSWQRIAIGLWFALIYISLWYLLQDVVANKALDRQQITDSLLMAGLICVAFGYIEIVTVFANRKLPPASLSDFLIRPTGITDNPDSLAALLILVIPLLVSRLFVVRGQIARIFLTAYLILATILLILTFSRGAWLGIGVGLIVLIALLLSRQNMLSVSRLTVWWRSQTRRLKVVIGGSLLLVLLVGLTMAVFTVRSLTLGGRTLDLRTYLYSAALQMVTEKPLTGYGLFAFGRQLLRLASTPPYSAHAHGHDVVLTVTAELGIVGLASLVVTILLSIRAMRHSWQAANQNARLLLAGAIAADVALFVHHLLDSPSNTTPFIAFAWICLMVVATAPFKPQPAPVPQRRVMSAMATGVWIFLLVTGFRSTILYKDYVATLQYTSQTGDFRGAAQRLQPLIDASPAMPIYYLYQGYFLAMGADSGDQTTAMQAIAAYRRFCDLEPYYSPAWANLAALYWQNGARDQAVKAMEQAVQVAPQAWMLQLNLGIYAEAVGDLARAHRAYSVGFTLYPDASILPEWQQTDVRRQAAAEVPKDNLSPLAQTVRLLSEGRITEAEQVWIQASSLPGVATTNHVVNAVLALAKGDRRTAADQIAAAEKVSGDPQSDAWLHLGLARLAQFDGNEATALQERDRARQFLAASSVARDDRIPAISYTQFWMIGLTEYFLAQVYAPPADAPLLVLLGSGVYI